MVRVCLQPSSESTASQVTVAGPQSSVAVTPVSQPGMIVGLQPRSRSAGQLTNVGGFKSSTHVNFCTQVASFSQPSFAVYVIVRVWTQPTASSTNANVTVAGPQSSVAVTPGSPVGIVVGGG